MSWAERLKAEISQKGVGYQPSKPSKDPLDSLDSATPTPFPKIQPAPGPGLHGWTLEQIRSHCHPSEWEEIKDSPAALEAVAADLRRHPFLYSGDTHGDVDVLVRCRDCAWFGRFNWHPFLGSCSKGHPEAAAGLWASTWRSCDTYVAEIVIRPGMPDGLTTDLAVDGFLAMARRTQNFSETRLEINEIRAL